MLPADVLPKVLIAASSIARFTKKVNSLPADYFIKKGIEDPALIPHERARLGDLGQLIVYVTLPKGEFTHIVMPGEWEWITK